MTPRPTLAIRARALRRKPTVRLVWLYLATSLPLQEAQVVKVASTAFLLGIPKRRMRHALRLLVRHGYLACATAPTMGTPGAYRFGPRAYARGAAPVTTGAALSPAAPLAQLSLPLPLSEAADHAA